MGQRRKEVIPRSAETAGSLTQTKTKTEEGHHDTRTATGNDIDDGGLTSGRRGGGRGKSKNGGGIDSGDKEKSARAIKQDRERKHDMKIKNMKKSDRRRFERNNRSQQRPQEAPGKKKKVTNGRWRK